MLRIIWSLSMLATAGILFTVAPANAGPAAEVFVGCEQETCETTDNCFWDCDSCEPDLYHPLSTVCSHFP